MGIGGSFWDLLKPYARNEGADFLRDKRVAVDLSFWIVQHEAAIRSKNPRARNPHIRNTFFRTVALFSKLGAYPVFVVDGDPSPLKAKARIERFFHMSGLGPSELPKPAENEGEATPVKQRNQFFTRCVRECVELLKLLGMPVIEARGEAEALCAQLNIEGHVGACITADSDAFLFGAKCIIKCLRSNSKEPFECYNVSDIEAGLGLRRKQMIAIALLVGNDHDLRGVPGFGVDTAVRFVQLYNEDEVLDWLQVIGKGDVNIVNVITNLPSSTVDSSNVRSPHCSNCGHPGSKSSHLKIACEHCVASGSQNCMKKPSGFKCTCSCCDEVRKTKEQQRHENWQIKMCKNIAAEPKFPNNEIIALYLSNDHGYYNEKDGPLLKWDKPKVEELVDFLTFYQHWEPSYIRQRMLPMLSTIFLREMASTQNESLMLYDQYKFHSIMRVKIRYGHPYYLVKWKRVAIGTVLHTVSDEQTEPHQIQSLGRDESADQLDEPDSPTILVDNGCCFLLTDENMDLVQAAFPKEVNKFSEEKKGKYEIKADISNKLASSKSPGVQLSITEFYRSTKVVAHDKSGEDSEDSCKSQPSRDKKKKSVDVNKNLPKSVRRRLLFD
ncbi:flap endonuclease GEN-like 1 [Canna indica]|uniref:Flap endonuclease GEN-like 1 n=1 Tax=Canna indica TaxID=4628 RepID=A0AAQ3QRU7_9LILI|nr:flap endonuclease GEN-like 1 [Canna indica]